MFRKVVFAQEKRAISDKTLNALEKSCCCHFPDLSLGNFFFLSLEKTNQPFFFSISKAKEEDGGCVEVVQGHGKKWQNAKKWKFLLRKNCLSFLQLIVVFEPKMSFFLPFLSVDFLQKNMLSFTK
jgi:hypothetical protein